MVLGRGVSNDLFRSTELPPDEVLLSLQPRRRVVGAVGIDAAFEFARDRIHRRIDARAIEQKLEAKRQFSALRRSIAQRFRQLEKELLK